MKKILLLVLSVIILTGCKSEEDKLKDLAINHVKNYMYVPDSFDLIDAKTNEARIDMIDTKYINLSEEVFNAKDMSDQYQERINRYMSLRDSYPQGSTQYNQWEQEVRREVSQRMKYDSRISNLINKVGKDYFFPTNPEKGYFVYLSFRAKDQSGNVDISNVMVIIDEQGKNVLRVFDLDSPSMRKFMQVYSTVKDLKPEDISDEEVDLEQLTNEISSYFE